jgi:hypothetical protein
MPKITVPTGGHTVRWKKGGEERNRILYRKKQFTLILIVLSPVFLFRIGLQDVVFMECLIPLFLILAFVLNEGYFNSKMAECIEETTPNYYTANTSRKGWWKW